MAHPRLWLGQSQCNWRHRPIYLILLKRKIKMFASSSVTLVICLDLFGDFRIYGFGFRVKIVSSVCDSRFGLSKKIMVWRPLWAGACRSDDKWRSIRDERRAILASVIDNGRFVAVQVTGRRRTNITVRPTVQLKSYVTTPCTSDALISLFRFRCHIPHRYDINERSRYRYRYLVSKYRKMHFYAAIKC